MISIIDYDAGNIKSVEKALEYLGQKAVITRDRDEIMASEGVILPGVGSFGDAMGKLKEYNLINTIYDVVDKKIPFMGICLGLQLLYRDSEESPGVSGLGILKGSILKIPERPGLKIPHMGWNELEMGVECPLLKNLGDAPYVYFVHSYMAECKEENLSAWVEYGGKVPAMIYDGKFVYGAQFHPEKSGDVGLQILRNFAEL
mgnify:CR=1 FL=1